MLVSRSEVSWGPYPLVHLECMVPDRCQNLSSKGGELEQDIPGVVGWIARWGKDRVLVLIASHKLVSSLSVLISFSSEGLGRKT